MADEASRDRESSGATVEEVMAVYPRHKAVVDVFVARGDVIGIGPFADRPTWRSSEAGKRRRRLLNRIRSRWREW